MAVPSISSRKQKRVKRKTNVIDDTSGKPTPEQIIVPKSGFGFLLLVFSISIFLLLLLASLFLFKSGNLGMIPYHLHSELEADYSADNQGFQFAVVQLDLIQEAMQDFGTRNPQGQYATLQAGLGLPVPSVTSHYLALVTQTPDLGIKTSTAIPTTINPVATAPWHTSTPTQRISTTPLSTWHPATTVSMTPTRQQPTSTHPGIKTKMATGTKPAPTITPKTPTKVPSAQPSRTFISPTHTNTPPTLTQPPPTLTIRPPTATIPPPTPTSLPPSPTNLPPTATNPPPTPTRSRPTNTPVPTPYP